MEPISEANAKSTRFPVAAVLVRRKSNSRWIDHSWNVTGIAVGRHADNTETRPIRGSDDEAFFLVGGLDLALFVDECESYYFNLVSETPRAYVVAHVDDTDGPPRPFRVTMSFDEAHAYLEGEDEIFAVDVPPEVYRWTEAFVVAHYFPEKKRKRKLRDWSRDEAGSPPEML
jgi:hypothetical protein